MYSEEINERSPMDTVENLVKGIGCTILTIVIPILVIGIFYLLEIITR